VQRFRVVTSVVKLFVPSAMMSVAERRLGDSLLSQMRVYLSSCYWLQQSEPFCLMLRDSAASLRVAEAWGMNHSPTKRGSKSSAFARCYSDFGHYYHLLHCCVICKITNATLAPLWRLVVLLSPKQLFITTNIPGSLICVCVYSAT